MALSLDPVKNPILEVYGFFSQPGLQRVDKAEFFGFRKLKLRTITSTRAQKLIKLLRTTPDAVNHFRLMLNNQRLVDFAPVSITEWFDRETIEHFSVQLCANCMGALSSLRDDLDAFQAGASWAGEDLVNDNLNVLDLLANCQSCGDRFELDVKLDKSVLVKEYLLDGPADVNENVSPLLWHDSESFRKAFDSFNSLLSFTLLKAEKPIVVFLYESAHSYQGDFFKIFSLTDSTVPSNRREQDLVEQLRAITTQILDDYKVLRLRHLNEHRPNERLDLPPSLFLQRKEELAKYPAHPLFTEGPLRSVLICAIMAWLADSSRLDGDVGHFMLPSDSTSADHLSLTFSLSDVQREGSIFDTNIDWQAITGLAVREIGLSAGREQLRTYWLNALKHLTVQDFAAPRFFSSLKAVYLDYGRLKEEQPVQISHPSHGLLEILVRLDAERKEIRFELNGLDYLHKPVGEVSLSESQSELRASELSKLARSQLSRILVPDVSNPKILVPSRHKLETQGVDLWINFIPEELKRAYATLRDQDLTIFIVSGDPSFPWELVKPLELKGGDISARGFTDMWLAVKFSIARWLSGSTPPPSEVALNRICCIADQRLSAAATERNYLEGIGTICDLPQTFDDLIMFLSERDYDLIHFACHGTFDRDDPGESVALLPDGYALTPKDFLVGGIMTKFSENHPLVFINSCHSGRTGQTLIGIEGWAKEFIDLKCGAFIGCGWEVDDKLAADFAMTFYDAFRTGLNLGKAMHEARGQLRKKTDNPTWLAYYLYGNPNCVLRNGS